MPVFCIDYGQILQSTVCLFMLSYVWVFGSNENKNINNLNYQKGIAEIMYYKALIYAKKNDYINAIANYTRSKELFLEQKDTLSVAKVNNSIGLIEIKRGNYKKGLQYSLSAIEELEKRNLKRELCSAYKSLATAYKKTNDRLKSIEFNLNAFNLNENLSKNN